MVARTEEEEIEEVEKKEEQRFLNCSVWEDVLLAFYESRFAAPLVALFGIFLAYHITIAPYRVDVADRSGAMSQSIEDLRLVRPVLSVNTVSGIRNVTLRADTKFYLPKPKEFETEINRTAATGSVAETVSLKFFEFSGSNGNFQAPDFFYNGVTFGLTTENPHNLEYTAQSTNSLKALKHDLLTMFPKPSFVMKRTATCNVTVCQTLRDWTENGFGVHFSYEDLHNQGKLSGDVLQPWKRVHEDIVWIARKYKQVYVTLWYPSKFGEHEDAESKVKDPHRYKSLIKQVIPTRTGLNELKSTVAVWLSGVNDLAPEIPDRVISKEWTDDDHWSQYTKP